jgi:hypothetical protein
MSRPVDPAIPTAERIKLRELAALTDQTLVLSGVELGDLINLDDAQNRDAILEALSVNRDDVSNWIVRRALRFPTTSAVQLWIEGCDRSKAIVAPSLPLPPRNPVEFFPE